MESRTFYGTGLATSGVIFSYTYSHSANLQQRQPQNTSNMATAIVKVQQPVRRVSDILTQVIESANNLVLGNNNRDSDSLDGVQNAILSDNVTFVTKPTQQLSFAPATTRQLKDQSPLIVTTQKEPAAALKHVATTGHAAKSAKNFLKRTETWAAGESHASAARTGAEDIHNARPIANATSARSSIGQKVKRFFSGKLPRFSVGGGGSSQAQIKHGEPALGDDSICEISADILRDAYPSSNGLGVRHSVPSTPPSHRAFVVESAVTEAGFDVEARGHARFESCPAKTLTATISKPNVFSKNDFDEIINLATGSFGVATLCRHKDSGLPCVVKSVDKNEAVRKNQHNHIMSERKALISLTESNCPFITRVYGTYHDIHNIYFVLEYVAGGELFAYMREKGRLTEYETQFYTAQVLMALEHMHVHYGMAYRDLKPENLLIASDGYLRVCDFGFAKELGKMEKTYTSCGTTDYIAPEVILSKGHSREVDLWSFGVLCYEMLTGEVPFKGETPYALYANILKGAFVMPDYLSSSAKDLISGLLKVDKNSRLGCSKKGIAELRKQAFYSRTDFELIKQKKLPAPHIPSLAGAFDVKQFADTVSDLAPQPAHTYTDTMQKISQRIDNRYFPNFDCVVTTVGTFDL